MASGDTLCPARCDWISLDGHQGRLRGDHRLLSLSHPLAQQQLSQGQCDDEIPHTVRHSAAYHSRVLFKNGEPSHHEYEECSWGDAGYSATGGYNYKGFMQLSLHHKSF